ncbi:SusC/RagA family TonB-linked outer membrane protein [Aestuariibaculum marinum]|uniref:TonB-dependent receptor n=1 Tax=Aestuariibaculum marinum TaxID=2683592 RepID=A0A8J6Q009_9FLAO|nr:TonB-dependent receptor [Aestuariibaculum marinum]MBD0825382.1 TonB-dependent receptor [Aestuariibaculum marinum]
MKVFVFLICTTVFGFSSIDGFSQEKIIIEKDIEIPVDEVFKIILKQTEYSFLYPEELFKKAPSVQLKKGEIELKSLLEDIFSKSKVSYRLSQDDVIIVEKISSPDLIKPDGQGIEITGRITDENGQPLPGANILEKGTANGVQSDFDGNFSLKVTNQGAVLVVSFLGYVTQEIQITEASFLDIGLKVDNNSLEEVVLVGYGTQRKKDVAGAISTVKGEDLVLSSSPSVGDALRGKAAGLQIVQNSAQPGGGLDFLIRGAGSVNASNQPLIVIDGFPITEFQQPDSGNRYDGGTQSILNSFNPNDIESISVLKDASATSIYGARAANGVILITSKKGKEGKVQVAYSASYSFQAYNDSYKLLGLKDWMQLRNEAAFENWAFLNRIYPYSDKTLEEAISNPVNGIPFTRFYSDEQINNAGQGTDWLSLVTRDGSTQQHNLSLSGGTNSTKYYLSGNLYKQDGVLKNSAFDRTSLRFNLDQKITNFLSFGMNLSMSRINNSNSQLGGDQFENSGIIRSALQYGPHIQAIDEEGNYPINPDNALEPNPYSLLTITDEGVIDRTLTNFFAELKPIKGLTARVQMGIDQGYSGRNTYLPRTTLWGALENGKASIASQKKNDELLDMTLNYSTIFDEEHNLSFLVGYSRQKYRSESANSGNSDFITDAFLWNNLNAGAGTKVLGSTKREDNLVSFFGRVNYVYKDKYILSSTIRRDGSSVFSRNNRFAIFPSLALGWDIAEESFMKNIQDQISQLKLRIGYGETGNADIGSNAFAAYYAQPAYLNPDESILIGVFPSRLENPDLKWETTKELNFGLDFQLFKGIVSGSVEVYNKEISDLLQVKPINSYNEINSVWANIGSTQSKGVEVTLNTVNVDSGDFRWESTLTFSKFKDSWKERAEDWKPAIYQQDNDPIRARYSYLSDGVMQIGEVVPAQPDLFPGQIKLKDINGYSRDEFGNPIVDEQGKFIPTGEPDGRIDDADIVLMGATDPDFIAGFSNRITYKNFDLKFHFNGMFGRKLVDPTDFAMGVSALGVATNGRNALTSVFDRWTPDNPTNTRPASHFGFTQYDSGDFFLQDAWFIRLQNLSLAYNLPSKWMGQLLTSAAIRFDAQNLFVITPYNGVDPETDSYVAAYPNVKTYSIGIDLKF